MSLTEKYLKDYLEQHHAHSCWYVGTENTIEQGLKTFLNYLNKKGEILVQDLEIVDYLNFFGNSEIVYLFFYKSLPKLEYLAAKGNQVSKNKKVVKL